MSPTTSQNPSAARIPERKKPPRKQKFQNQPLLDFGNADVRALMEKALARVERAFGAEFPLVIGGESVSTGEWIVSRNPNEPSVVVGKVARAHAAEVDRAVDSAVEAQKEWGRTPYDRRAGVIFKTAQLFRSRRHELNAYMVLEAGKSWVEADADTAEAIDFLEFYGREMLRYGADQPLTPVEGEDNRLQYLPLGVVAVIPPWNFPVAILTGMTAAALVAGNAVVLKPSSETPAVGAKVAELFRRAGIPDGVLNFVPGNGADIGDHLVTHPLVRAISFTGSMQVGLRINELAARTPPEQLWIKRVVAEMGGKDAIVVDESADLDLAADGVVASAFGFQGQKCSACSRLIAVDSIYDELVQKVVERASALKIGPSSDPQNDVGPVISEAALEKILSYMELGADEGECLLGGERARPMGHEQGYFVQPTIFSEVNSRARLSQEEIFGPVLACERARDFDDALRIANGTPYGLTGSVYSKNRANLERARETFHAGNLYLNRKCTGALVGAHPFGGFNRSGTDSKAGGRDYLLLFLQAKLVSERIGLAPEADSD